VTHQLRLESFIEYVANLKVDPTQSFVRGLDRSETHLFLLGSLGEHLVHLRLVTQH
jgi:hypothetical protein